MPSASNDLISAALTSAYKRKTNFPGQKSSLALSEQLLTSSKQILLNTIEYEQVNGDGGFKLSSIKNRHVNLSSKCLKNQVLNNMAQGKNEDKLEEPRVVLWSPEKVTLGWKKSFHPGAGMTNLGNTCYLNSSLQALFHIPAMANWLLDEMGLHIERCESNSQNVAFCSICAMMRTLKMSLDRCNNIIKPTLIHTKLKCIGKTLMYGRQEDAHEFIKLLIDHMEKSYIMFQRAHKLDYRSKETTPLNQIFGGYLRQQVICPLCRYVSTTFSHFQDLVLDIRSVASVEEALALYFRKETLDSDNAYKCENCHKKVPATKRHLIERAPYVLLLQLKRFTISGGKITKHVNIQKNIDLSRYINGLRQSKEDGSYCYRLVSMVIHIGGSQHGGHYTAIAQTSNGIMFEFDDSSVHSIPLQSALLRNPYILFYEMVRKPKDIPGAKQVIRQSSERALLSQKPCDSSSKSLPTSRSTSCMANGTIGAKNDASQDLRKGLYNPKSPLPSQKDREKVVFGIKAPSSDKAPKEARSKLSKPSGSCNSSSSQMVGKNFSWSRNGPLVNSSNHLAACSEDSESDEETLTNGLTNGHSCLPPQADHSTNYKEVKSKFSSNKSTKEEDNLSYKTSVSSSSSSDNTKHNHTFLPRSLQVLTSNSRGENSACHPNSPSKIRNTKASDANHLNDNSDKSSSVKDYSKNGKGNLVPKSNENNSVHNSHCGKTKQIPSDNLNSALSNSDSDSRRSLGYPNKKEDASSFSAHQPKLESQKSFSQDSTTDKSETDSVESKFSQDSNRSDKSSRSVKKSIFSLLSCVSSASSPDLSPNEEEESTISSEKNSLKSNLSNGLGQRNKDSLQNSCQEDNSDSEGTDSDSSLSKRDRDLEEQDTISPSKKCKPESLPRINGCQALSEIRYAYTDTRETSPSEDQSSHHREKHKKRNGIARSKMNNELHMGNVPSSSNTTSEENFSMEEKKSRHKWKSSDYEDSRRKDPKNSFLNNGHSRLNPNVINIDWNKNLRDLSHILAYKGSNGHKNLASDDSTLDTGSSIPLCNGNSSSVVDTLKSSASLPFGVRVKKWNDTLSNLEADSTQEKQDGLKRTYDDIHNEEIDSGKVQKKRSKSQNRDFGFRIENPFQKHQEYSNNNSNTSNNSKCDAYSWRYSAKASGRPNHNRHHPYNHHRKFSRSNGWPSSSRQYPFNQNRYHGSSFPRGNRGGLSWHRKNNMNFKRHNLNYRENRHSNY